MGTYNLQEIKKRYNIVGLSDGLNRALDIAIQVAPTDLSVLIQGESGVGKEAIPRIIHDNSVRKHQKYFAINCGSIPEGTIDSELFGHEKGAFTGAIGERDGYFGAANKGTLFLDEVGELPLATQARLLRVLETGEYIRVGSADVRKTDVRIIAATNVNLQKAISEGKFREDLYYRLATIPISIPPLRERGKDIELLFRKFTRDFAEKYRLDPITLSEDASQLLLQYKWPGNIRQLKNIAEQISIISREREITADTLRLFGLSNDTAAGTGLILSTPKQGQGSRYSYENEREMLFQILSNLGKDVKDLKEMMNMQKTMSQHSDSTPNITSYDFEERPQIIQQQTDDKIIRSVPHGSAPLVDIYEPPVGNDVFTAETYVEQVPRSMREMEEQSIRESLRRNNGNRGKTARELGISERTLYRKIKTYGLDEE